MNDPCLLDTLAIDATKFANPAIIYDIRSDAITFSWTDSHVTSNNSLSDCGAFTWEIFKSDGTSTIDSAVYTLGDFSAATKII